MARNPRPIQVVRGPRQCGKTSLLLHLGDGFQEVSLDDPAMRALATRDPELLIKQFGPKLFIDEVQYAPGLFPSLKRHADLYKRNRKGPLETIIRLTGSNQIVMDRNVKESLAGRASFFDLNTLSVEEILRGATLPIQQIIYAGGWPEVHARQLDPKKYLDDYIVSYIEKDVVLAAGILKRREFLRFVQQLAGRVGQVFEAASLAGECGVDAKTIREWTSALEQMQIIALVPPFASNLTTRLVKSPKLYFLDTGLACRLQGWTDPVPILTSPQQGGLFENLVFTEIWKTSTYLQLGWRVFHWRSRDQEEIDFLIERGPGDWIFVEAKVSTQPVPDYRNYPQVRKLFARGVPPLLLCHQEGHTALGAHVPVGLLARTLRERVPEV